MQVVVAHLGSQEPRHIRHLTAHVSQTDDAHGRAGDLPHSRGNQVPSQVPVVARLDLTIGHDDTPLQCDHECNGELRHRDRIVSGGSRHRDIEHGCTGEVHMADRRPHTLDEPNRRNLPQDPPVQRVCFRVHEQYIGAPACLDEFIVVVGAAVVELEVSRRCRPRLADTRVG